MSTENEIREVLQTYERALNTDDATLAVACYTGDGVFMPSGLPAATGTQALQAMYGQIFATLRLRVAFTVDEVVVAGDTVAYALTQSRGTQTLLASNTESSEANREVFIFRREHGAWKIARYLFNQAA